MLGYRPTEHYAWTSIKSATRPILKSSFLATAYSVYQRNCFRHNFSPSHSVHSLAAIRILSGPRAERNPPLLKTGRLLLKCPLKIARPSHFAASLDRWRLSLEADVRLSPFDFCAARPASFAHEIGRAHV